VPAGLYVHFPFCRGKCPYCHFSSVPINDDLYLEWWEALKREAAGLARERRTFDTLYLGGGTPSLLAPDDLFALREMLAGYFLTDFREFTLEANPGRPDKDRMRSWRDAGVSRLSVGVQSFDDRILKTLDRGYLATEGRSFCRAALETGFSSLSVDLMTGVPGETRESAERTLDEVVRLGPDHVSLYILENVEGLPFEKVLKDNPVDEDAAADIYRIYQDGLNEAGLRQYEISNFARPGKECLHNLKYWRYEPFLGLGPSACSHLGHRRWCNKRELREWAGALRRGEPLHEELVELTPEASALEALVFGLRLVEGVDLEALKVRYGTDLEMKFAREIHELTKEGWLIQEGSAIRIPPDRFLVSNHIFSRFV